MVVLAMLAQMYHSRIRECLGEHKQEIIMMRRINMKIMMNGRAAMLVMQNTLRIAMNK